MSERNWTDVQTNEWMDSFPGGCAYALTAMNGTEMEWRVGSTFEALCLTPPQFCGEKWKREREVGTGAMREQIFAVLTALYDMWGDSHVERDLSLLRTIVKYMLYRAIRLMVQRVQSDYWFLFP